MVIVSIYMKILTPVGMNRCWGTSVHKKSGFTAAFFIYALFGLFILFHFVGAVVSF